MERKTAVRTHTSFLGIVLQWPTLPQSSLLAYRQGGQVEDMEDLTRLFVVCGKAAEVLLDHAASATGCMYVEGIGSVLVLLFRSTCSQ